MIKTQFTFLFLFIATFQTYAQYSIVKVVGDVRDLSEKRVVDYYNPIREKTVLKFSSPSDYLIVADSSENIYYLPAPSSDPYIRKVGALLPEELDYPVVDKVPATKEEVAAMFFGDDPIVLTDGLTFHVDGLAFPQNLKSHFFISYDYNFHKIDKKIYNRGDYMLIDPLELYTVDTKPISWEAPKNYQLFYYRPKKRRTEFITDINPVVVNGQQLHKELLYLSQVNGGDHHGNFPIMYQYIRREYGLIPLESLKDWVLDNFYVED